MERNPITGHEVAAGTAIEDRSFAIIDALIGTHGHTAEQWPIVRRLIHTSGDPEINPLIQFHPKAVRAGIQALQSGCTILADVKMVQVGLSPRRLAAYGNRVVNYLSDPKVRALAKQEETTLSVQAMRSAWRDGVLDGAIVGVGNAPTALLELIQLMRNEQVRPALIIGMPVGFVSAAESKEALKLGSPVPWMMIEGTKGGSPLVVAAIHALIGLAVEG
ncbi:MAG: precorrin-8X methylmutase [Magnetococcales bacterium]|nr:precorrin-8X methylmutase [Magnetococcales bacterium]